MPPPHGKQKIKKKFFFYPLCKRGGWGVFLCFRNWGLFARFKRFPKTRGKGVGILNSPPASFKNPSETKKKKLMKKTKGLRKNWFNRVGGGPRPFFLFLGQGKRGLFFLKRGGKTFFFAGGGGGGKGGGPRFFPFLKGPGVWYFFSPNPLFLGEFFFFLGRGFPPAARKIFFFFFPFGGFFMVGRGGGGIFAPQPKFWGGKRGVKF